MRKVAIIIIVTIVLSAITYAGTNGYSGDYIDMYDNSNIKVFGISANGNIYIPLQSYDDDAAAGVGGLQTNEMYQTSATNTLGLPAGEQIAYLKAGKNGIKIRP